MPINKSWKINRYKNCVFTESLFGAKVVPEPVFLESLEGRIYGGCCGVDCAGRSRCAGGSDNCRGARALGRAPVRGAIDRHPTGDAGVANGAKSDFFSPAQPHDAGHEPATWAGAQIGR